MAQVGGKQSDAAAGRDRRTHAAFALLLAVQLALAVCFALNKSLVQDELHTRFHASAVDLASLLSNLRQDNHPPLSFLLVRAGRACLGDSELALRAPLILCGLATTCYVARLCRRLGAPPLLGAGLWALASTQLEFSTQVRMYALSALCSAAALEALLAVAAARDGSARLRTGLAFAFWSWAGLHTHYYWVLYAGGLGLTLLLASARAGAARAALARLWPGVALVLVCSAPWYAWGLGAQLGSQLPPGMARSGLLAVPEASLHLLMSNMSLAGPRLRWVFIVAGLLVALLALGGARELWRSGRRLEFLCLSSVALAVPAGAALLSLAWPRLGFNWSYVLPSAPAFVVLAAVSAARDRRALALGRLLLVPVGLLGLMNVLWSDTEDNRAAVQWVLDDWRPGDAVVNVERQSPVFGQSLAWSYYAERLTPRASARGIVRLAVGPDFDLVDPQAGPGHRRVLVIAKALTNADPLLLRLRGLYDSEQVARFGFGLYGHTFSQPRD